jgi:hypothetical protein
VTGVTIDLAAELVGRPGLAFADALHLRRVQRVDLGPALALLLMANPQREIEGASNYTYAEACPSESLSDWIGVHANLFSFWAACRSAWSAIISRPP